MTSILTNIAATSALQTLRSIDSQLLQAQRQVSTGLRVGTASDNSAYWSIATTMRSDNMAVSAVADALGLGAAKLDVSYAGVEAVSDILTEFKARLVAAKEDGVDKEKIQTELNQLKEQVVAVASSASFNGVNWLNTDIPDINDSDLNKVSLTSSFVRSENGVSVKTIDFHLSEIALFNETGGGILQADTRKMKTLGGIRLADTYMDAAGAIHTFPTNSNPGYRAVKDFTFTGPVTFETGDTINFDITVDADNPANVDPPYHLGKTTHVVIDRAIVDAALPSSDGVISTYAEFAEVLKRALPSSTGAIATTYVDYYYQPIINVIGIQTRENSGLFGSSVEITNLDFSSVGSGGGLTNFLEYGTRGSQITLQFDPFEVYPDGDNRDGVSVSFDFSINHLPATAHTFDRTYVNDLLGKTNGKIQTADEMVTLLQSLLGSEWPDVIIETTPGGDVTLRSDKAVDRLTGGRTALDFTEIAVSIEPLAEQCFLDIDIVANPSALDRYLGYIEVVSTDVIEAAATLGALQSRVEMQESFAHDIMDAIDRGIGRLVDADMNEASTRLKALQTQEQLAIQSLSIANANAENIVQLFR